MGALYSYIFPKKKDADRKPIKGIVDRIKNLFRVHYRGLVGVLVPVLTLTWHNHNKDDKSHITTCMWIWMTWNFLIHPVNIPVTGLIPVFILPFTGVVSTDNICFCYMREGIMMFLLSSMTGLLLNNSGFDRRMALWFFNSGGNAQFSAKRLVFKASMAGFWLSLLSSRLISCALIMDYTTKLFTGLEGKPDKKKDKNVPDYTKIRYIVNSAVSTSCTIGSIGMIHSSYPILVFRLLFNESAQNKMCWPDVLNYLEYSSFAFPLSIVMFLFNLLYHITLMGTCKKMTSDQMSTIKTTFKDHRKKIPAKVTLHEKMTLVSLVILLICYFFRWNKYFHGWSYYRRYNALIPQIEDATVAATFVFLLHSLPSSFKFVKKFTAKKKSELMPNKPESGILWWRFVDKNTNYGYIYPMGGGVALLKAIRDSNLNYDITKGPIGRFFTGKPWTVSLLLITAVSMILGNIMSPAAACLTIFPLVVNMYMQEPVIETPVELRAKLIDRVSTTDLHIACLACGIATSLSFMLPFLYTPSYFNYYVGKVPKKRMAPYGLITMVICILILWLGVSFYAPILWGSVEQITAPSTGKSTTSKETDAGGAAEGA